MKEYEIRKVIHIFIGVMFYLFYIIIDEIGIYVSSLFIFSLGIILMYAIGMHKEIKGVKNILDKVRKKEEVIGESVLFMISSYILGAVLLDKNTFFIMFWLISISDVFATIIGKRIGRVKIYKNKTLEGSLGFFIASLPLLILSGFDSLFYIIAGVFVEAVEDLEDNISIAMMLALMKRFF